MKKTIKYLQNGEYHYATVKDVGDIDLLKTSNKDDLVSAINEIIVNGVAGGGGISQDQLDKINSDIRGVSADIAAKYSELQGKISDGDAMQASLRAQAIKDINGAIAAANAAIEEYKKANEEAIKATQADIDAQNNRIDRINEQADALRTDLATAQTDLTQTKTDLSNATLDFGKVKKTVVDLQDEVSTKLSNTDLDPLNQKIQSVESDVKQTKDELSQYVKHDEYDLTTGEVNKIKSNVQQLADRVETKVSRDTLNDDINEFVVKKANLLVQTRDWSIISDAGWKFSNDGLIAIQAELYDHAHVLEIHQTGVYAEQTIKGLHGGQSYTVSVNAKIKDTASGANITLVGNDKTLGIMKRVKTHDTDISTEYERYEYTLVAPSDTLVLRLIATGIANSNVLYLYKAKLEEGTKSYEWEMNANDIYAKVEKNSATLTTYDDRITGVVTKQQDFGTWKEQAQTAITQTADGLEINNQKLKSVNGDVVDVIQSKIDASAEKLTSDYEKFTNQQVGMIVDEGTNQILNSAFTYYDLDSKDVKKRNYTFDSWQNISAKATIKSIGKVNWVHMAQSGLSNDNPISITSNTFAVKQGKVIVGVDVLTPNVSAIDNQKVLVLQFYDNNGTRVDYREVSLHDLGLDTIQSNVSKRGTYRVGIDRKDVTKMTILARLPRNGEINFTNFFAKVSSLDNGDYQPNPADLQQQTIKQQTAIEQTADTIQLKADQTKVDTLSGTVQRQGTLIEQNAQHIQLKADGTTVTALSNKTDELSKLVEKHSASLEVTDKAITQQASAISSVTTIANNASAKIDGLRIGGRNLLKNSDTMDGWYRNQLWTKLSDTRKGCAIWQYTNGRWNGLSTWVYVEKGEIYTFSVDARLLDRESVPAHMYIDLNVDNENGYNKATTQYEDASYARHENAPSLSKEWNRYKVTFVVTSNGYVRPRVETDDYATLQISRPKLEEGNVATPWQPSDLDLPNTIVTTVTEVSNASQIVKSSGIYTDINSVKTETMGKINAVNDKVDNLSFGGRNLLNGSATLKIVGPADSNVRDGTWRLSNYGNSTPLQNVTNELPPVVGVTNAIKISPLTGAAQDKAKLSKGTYTFSVWLKGTAGMKYALQPFWNTTATYGSSPELTLQTNDWDRVSFTVDLKTDENVISTAYVYNHDKTNVLYMAAPQLEKSNKESDWSLSQDDLQRLAHDDAASQINTNITPISTTVNQYTHTTDNLANQVTDIFKDIGYDQANHTFTDTFKEVVETAGGTKETYKALEGKIDGIVVGGKNLLDGTADFNSNYWYAANGTADIMQINGKIAVKGSKNWEGRRYNQTIDLEPDTDYTVSVYVRVNGKDGSGLKLGFYCNLDGNDDSWGLFNLGTLSTEWKRVSLKWHNNNHRKMTIPRVEWSGDFTTGLGSGFTSELQIEKGNKPSDWGMSDNDINQKVAEAKKAADNNATSLTEYKRTVDNTYAKSEDVFSSVTKEDFKNIMKNATFLKTADGFETTVKSQVTPMVAGGGVNLLPRTSADYSARQYASGWSVGWLTTDNQAYNIPINGGETYTLTATIKNDASSADNVDLEWYQWDSNRKNTANGNSAQYVAPGQEKTISFTQTMQPNTTHIQPHARARSNKGAMYWWKNVKVEKGTVATPWTPCPVDIANEDYVNQHVATAKSDVTELVNNKTKDISTIKQTADKVSISVGKMFGQADASNLDVDANGVRLKGKLLQLDGDVNIAPGFKLKADYIQSGTLNTDNLIMKHPQGSTVTFTQDGFDVQKTDNREAFYTIGGDGMEFWRMSDSEAMDDYPAHIKPGYVHLGSLVALDNSYTKSTRRVDRLQQGVQQNKVSNDNGIGFIIDVTGGSDTFSILQKGAEYRKGDRSGRINFNDTVNNSHFPIWEVNATGFRSLSYPQSNFMHGRGILHYTNTYFFTDPVMGTASQKTGVDYYPSQRLGFIGNNGYGDFNISADNNNTMAVNAGSHNQNVWVNGFIFGSQDGADRIFGYDGSQWVDFVNKRTTRDNNDLANHYASLHLWELQYNTLTHTSQLSKKTDIEPLDTKDFASKILSIDLYKYRYKTQDKNEKDNYGAIIDDVNEVKQYNLPQEFITTRDKGINDSHLITGLIATVQEQAKQIEQLSFRVLELERGASING